MRRHQIALLFAVSVTLLLCSAGLVIAADVSGGGDIVYTQPVKSVLFSHKLHVDEKGLGCEMCHMKLFEMQALAVQKHPDFNMKSLYKEKYCGACHDGKTAFASNTQCARCHGGVKEYEAVIAQKKDKPSVGVARGPQEAITIGTGDSSVKFIHVTHTNKFTCNECHTKLFALIKGQNKITMAAIYQGRSCGACHNGKKAFSSDRCEKCHANVPAPKTALVYKPEGIGMVKFSHEFHTKSFACKDCHDKIFKMKKGGSKMTMEAMNAGGSCGTCHNGTKATAVTECGKCHAE
jgi:c(7)-type cytochrome triheme protein